LLEDRSFALLVRVWFEDEVDDFRARVTALAAGSERPRREATIAVATSPREVLDAVSEWLDALVRHGEDPIDGD
jgi:hypothetical protein